MRKITVVGIGPGNKEYITPAALQVIKESDTLMGSRRSLEPFEYLGKTVFTITPRLADAANYIIKNAGLENICVLASGDPSVYSIADYLRHTLSDIEIEIVPGISSVQYLCSKIGRNLHDIKLLSLHGRSENIEAALSENETVAVFTDYQNTPSYVCRRLINRGFENLDVTVGENLSYENERIVRGKAEEILDAKFVGLTLMLIEHKLKSVYSAPSISDDDFIRGSVPMTKEEVRAVTVSKLKLFPDSTVWDIGAGTGSVSVECARMCPYGKIFSVEKNEEGISLLKQNFKKFNVYNAVIASGDAIAKIADLPSPDRIFIGGYDADLKEFLKEVIDMSSKNFRVVINAVTIEKVYKAVTALQALDFSNTEIVNVSVSRSLEFGSSHMMKANNPVYIVSGDYPPAV